MPATVSDLNVMALAEIIGRLGIVPKHDSWCRAMARALAAQGVLATNTLTGEHMVEVYCELDRGHPELGANDPKVQARAIDLLARIAKGEAF